MWCGDRAGCSQGPQPCAVPGTHVPRRLRTPATTKRRAQTRGTTKSKGSESASNPQTCRCQTERATERHGRLVRIRPLWCTLLLAYGCVKPVVPSVSPAILMSLVYLLLNRRLPLSPQKKKQTGKEFSQLIQKVLNGRGEVELVKTPLLSPKKRS